MPDAVLTQLFQHKAWCNRRMIAALRAAPDDVDRRQMTILLLTFEHTSIVDRIFKAHLSGVAHDFTEAAGNRRPDLDALAATMAETDQWYLDYVAGAAQSELETPVAFTFVDGDEGLMTKAQMLAHVITHAAAHRGAIGKMMSELNIKGAPEMVTTMLGQREGVGD
jgi:uncharacterized damage-inducible protein DinB